MPETTTDQKSDAHSVNSQTSDQRPSAPSHQPRTTDYRSQATSPRDYLPKAQAFMQNPQEDQSITVGQLKMEKDKCFLLDVRQPEEIAEGKIPGAVPIPLTEVPAKVSDIPKNKPIITVCAHGGRAAATMFFLKDKGYKNVKTLLGGTEAWKDAGYEVE